MTRERSSHQPKTWDERRIYLETTIRQKLSPTVHEHTEEIDSTETTAAGSEVPTSYRPTTARKKSRFATLRGHWPKVAVGLVVVPLAGWILVQLYSLNREVGEIRVRIDGTAQQQEQLKKDLERVDEHVTHEIDRIDNRMNGISKPPD